DLVADTLIKKFDFDGTNNGSEPYGSLMQATNGKLYGMTSIGGTNSLGVLFQYDPAADTLIKKFDFDGTNYGGLPHGSLMQATDGNLYGMTNWGGTTNNGVLFQYDPVADTLIKKFDFGGTNYGENPFGSLMQATDGKLYGMTNSNWANGIGVLFQYDPVTDTLIKKIDFDGA
ncbi:MAG: hypothetical protein QQN42_08190, partial [Nitrosopumilus sp.]